VATEADESDNSAFEPVTLAFVDLCYFVPHPKKRRQELQLLTNITGSFLPGRMVALVGASLWAAGTRECDG
jgi:hypothetical protein